MAIDIQHLQTWVGREESIEDDITLFPAKALSAALNGTKEFSKGDALPPFWEWLYFLPTPTANATGKDGHPDKGGFLPPVPLPRRMWAAGEVECIKSLVIGSPATRTSTIESVDLKEGKTGTLVFVNVRHEYFQFGEKCISQVQNIVYREQPSEPSALPPGKPASVETDFSEMVNVDPVLLFRYSALTFNGHRIHYDRDYAVDIEFYSALVVHGPLLVTLLLDLLHRNKPGITMQTFKFRAMRPTFDDNSFSISGCQIESEGSGDHYKLWSSDHDGFECMQLNCVI